MAAELLAARNLSKAYGAQRWRGGGAARAVLREVSLTVARGETLALVGPSGSGKSTLARCLAGWETADSGEIRLSAGTRIQMIVQQPAASLNPRFTAKQAIEEPLVVQRRAREGAAAGAMRLVGMQADSMERRTHEFSGGERQRLAIARALVVDPDLLILDESFAGLDWRLQEQIAGLLRELQARLGLAYLVVAHDLELVAGMAHRLAVMEEGRIVEEGPAGEVLGRPRHRLTRELVEAARALSLDGGGS